MSGSLNKDVLVLNKHWSPIRIVSVERAIKAVCRERAEILDEIDYNPHKWGTWCELKADPATGIKTTSGYIRLPEIIVLTSYDKIPNYKVRVSRKNVWARDNGECQYTGRKLSFNDATLDHVIPSSRGGSNDFDNLVTCASDVNLKKGNRTPEEAGLKLRRKPKAPKFSPIYTRVPKNPPKSWFQFLPELAGT